MINISQAQRRERQRMILTMITLLSILISLYLLGLPTRKEYEEIRDKHPARGFALKKRKNSVREGDVLMAQAEEKRYIYYTEDNASGEVYLAKWKDGTFQLVSLESEDLEFEESVTYFTEKKMHSLLKRLKRLDRENLEWDRKVDEFFMGLKQMSVVLYEEDEE